MLNPNHNQMPSVANNVRSQSKRHRIDNPYGSPTSIPEIKKSLTISKEELVLQKHYGNNFESYFKNNQNMADSIAKKLRQASNASGQSPQKSAAFLQQRISQQRLNSSEVIQEKRAQLKLDFENRIRDIKKRNDEIEKKQLKKQKDQELMRKHIIQQREEKHGVILNRKKALEKDHQQRVEQQLSKQYSSTKSLVLNPLETSKNDGDLNQPEQFSAKRTYGLIQSHGPQTQKAQNTRKLQNSSQQQEMMVLKDIHEINSKIKHAIENRNSQLNKLKQTAEQSQTKYLSQNHQEMRQLELDQKETDYRNAFLVKNSEKEKKLKKKEKDDKLTLDYKIEQKQEKLQKAKKQHNALLQEVHLKQEMMRKKNRNNTQQRLNESQFDAVASKREDKEIKIQEQRQNYLRIKNNQTAYKMHLQVKLISKNQRVQEMMDGRGRHQMGSNSESMPLITDTRLK